MINFIASEKVVVVAQLLIHANAEDVLQSPALLA